MKITARVLGSKIVLDCRPFFGESYTVYLSRIDNKWLLPSGRKATRAMLSAVDRLSGVTLTRRP